MNPDLESFLIRLGQGLILMLGLYLIFKYTVLKNKGDKNGKKRIILK